MKKKAYCGLFLVLVLTSIAQFLTVSLSKASSSSVQGTLKWKFKTNGPITNSAPAVGSDGTIYVGSSDSKLYALNADGSLKWTCETDGPVASSPAIGQDGTIYIGAGNGDLYGSLYAIDSGGTIKWSFKTKGLIESAAAVGPDASIYVAVAIPGMNQGGVIHALDSAGNLKWEYVTNAMSGFYCAPTIGSDGTVYVADGEANLYAFSSEGTLKYTQQSAASPVIGSDGTNYIWYKNNSQTTQNNVLIAVGPDGSRNSTYVVGGPAMPVIGLNGMLYIGTSNLHAFSHDLKLQWTYSTNAQTTVPLVGSDGTIYAATDDRSNGAYGLVYAIDPNGELKWTYRTEGSVYLAPTMGPDGTLYVGALDGCIYAINTSSAGLANSAWPTIQHDSKHTGYQPSMHQALSILGRVTSDGLPLPWVTITLGGSLQDIVTTTQNDGSYKFTGLGSGSFNLVASQYGYTFNPASRSVVIGSSDVSGQDFTAALQTHSISGMVQAGGASLPGVTVKLGGSESRSATTDSKGAYEFGGLGNGVFVITPDKDPYIFSPSNRSVNINGKDLTAQDFTGALPADSGSLTVLIEPEAAVSAGARWKVDNGQWQNSGDTVSGLTAGSHAVSFMDIPDWTPPSTQSVTIEGGKSARITANYSAPPLGSLSISILPSQAAAAGARWNIDGGEWLESSVVVDNLSAGPHAVGFKDISGWTTPPVRTLNIAGGETTSISVTYEGIGTPKWTLQTRDEMVSSPAIGSDGTVYVGSGYLYALNPDGTIKWKYINGINSIDSAPAIGADGTIYVGSAFGYLQALNPDGTLKWMYATSQRPEVTPAIGSDGTIYVGSSDMNVYALNPDGTLKWTFKTGGAIFSSAAVGSDGTVYVGSDDKNLYAIDSSGALKWSYATNDRVECSPAIGQDGTIYVGSNDNVLYAVSSNGTLKWSYNLGGWIRSSVAIGSDGSIYAGSWNGNLYAFSPAGALKWTYQTGWIMAAPAIGADETIYFGTWDGKFYGLGPDGKLRWSFDTGCPLTSAAIDSDGTIYAGSDAYSCKNVYAFRSGSMGLANSAWPMFAHDAQHTGNLSNRAAPAYSISGTVSAAGSPLFDVTVTLAGPVSRTLTTGRDGTFLFSDLAKGTYTVTAGKDLFTFEPASRTVLIDGKGLSGQDFTASPITGSIKVSIGPASAVSAGARWRVDQGEWQAAEQTVSGISSGSHVVSFKDLSGWITPSAQDVVVSGGQVSFASANYGVSSQAGALRVELFPSEAVQAGAQWMVDTGNWQESGATVQNLAAGSHTITYKGLSGWSAPDNQVVVITSGATNAVRATYTGEGVPKWTYKTAWQAYSPAIGSDGTIYQTNGNRLDALNPDGTVKWTYSTTGLIKCSPAIGWDGTIYIWSMDSSTNPAILSAVTPDGTLKWENRYGWDNQSAAGYIESPAIGQDGTIYTTVWSYQGGNLCYGVLSAIDSSNGTQSWTFDLGGIGTSPVIGPDETIYVASADDHCNGTTGSLYAIRTDGSLKWRYQTAQRISAPPAIDWDGTIYSGSGANGFCALNPDGTVKWTQKIDDTDSVSSQPAIGWDGTVYVGSSNQKLYAFAQDGVLKWTYKTDSSDWSASILSSPALGSDGTIYFGSGLRLYALNPDGAILWKYKTGGLVWASPVIGMDGTVYVGSSTWPNPDYCDSTIYAFSSGSAGPADSAWPMFQHDLGRSGNALYQTAPTHAISGKVNGAGVPLAGVVVTLEGTATWTNTTKADGTYSFVGLPDGLYTVTPSMSGATFNPLSIAVTLSGQDISGQDFSGTLPTGSISATISPQAAAAAGGSWRVDGGSWKGSAETVSGLLAGSHTVSFKDISGWTTPASQDVTIVEDQTAKVTGSYVAQTASLTVGITPQDAVNKGAQWRVDGGAWQSSATTLSVLAGSHTVSFKDVSGYVTPAAQSVTLSGGDKKSLSAVYVPGCGLTVTITPADAVSRGAKWQLGSNTYSSGQTVYLAAGTYTVKFTNVSGYTTPAAQSVALTSGKSQSLSAKYVPLPGKVTFSLSPADACNKGAKWTINKVSYKSGQTASLQPGTYVVTFSNVTGYKTPLSQTVSLGPGDSKTFSAAYTSLPGKLIVSLSPTDAVAKGAKWTINGQSYSSGQTVSLPAGTYSVSFSTVSGYVSPALQTVTISSNATKRISAKYAAYAKLKVTISPADAVAKGAAWLVKGIRYTSGQTASLPAGTYTVGFSDVTGYAAPAAISVSLSSGATKTLSATYTKK